MFSSIPTIQIILLRFLLEVKARKNISLGLLRLELAFLKFIFMKVSARNVFKGTIKSILPGMVTTEVIIEVSPGLEIASVITKSSAESLNLKVGDTAYAVIKSSDVIVATD